MEQLAYIVIFMFVLIIVGIFVTGFFVAKIGLIAIVYALAIVGLLSLISRIGG